MTNLDLLAANGSLAQNAEAAKNGVPTTGLMQPKLDGWRLLANVREDGVALYSRTGKRYDHQLPQVTAELAKRFPAGTWLDGEAVAMSVDADGQVRNDWHVAQTVMTTHGGSPLAAKMSYVVFDILQHGDVDARPLQYAKRLAFLTRAMESVQAPVQLITTIDATAENHDKLVTIGFEGSVVKSKTASYASGKRGHGWTKIKAVATEDVVVMGFEPGRDVGAIIFGQMKNGQLVKRGTCKRKAIVPADQSQVGTVIEVEFNAVTKDGSLRHPRLLRRREDKTADQCVWA